MLLTFFWDQEIETIATRYYSSKFLCYSNAKALKQSLEKEHLSKQPFRKSLVKTKIIQIAMK